MSEHQIRNDASRLSTSAVFLTWLVLNLRSPRRSREAVERSMPMSLPHSVAVIGLEVVFPAVFAVVGAGHGDPCGEVGGGDTTRPALGG